MAKIRAVWQVLLTPRPKLTIWGVHLWSKSGPCDKFWLPLSQNLPLGVPANLGFVSFGDPSAKTYYFGCTCWYVLRRWSPTYVNYVYFSSVERKCNKLTSTSMYIWARGSRMEQTWSQHFIFWHLARGWSQHWYNIKPKFNKNLIQISQNR